MKFKTDKDGRPVAWGRHNHMDGKELPDPPGDPRNFKWDGDGWREDPLPPETPDRWDRMTVKERIDRLAEEVFGP